MATEIERKFLVVSDDWRQRVTRSADMVQGYLGGRGKASIRIRVAGDLAWLNIKSAEAGTTRLEYEYVIPAGEGRAMLARLSEQPPLEKTRYWIAEGEDTWELDVFHGENAGLVTAELELAHEDQPFARPCWLGREVTDEVRYYNHNLASCPYSRWVKE